jgi:hypothetical protein
MEILELPNGWELCDAEGFGDYYLQTPMGLSVAKSVCFHHSDAKPFAAAMNAPQQELERVKAQLEVVREEATFDGCFTGLCDVNGNRIYFGDTLEFDEREWGCPYTFQVVYDPRGIAHASDIPNWCCKVDAALKASE